MGCCGGFVGQVLNGPTDAVNKVVDEATKNPLATAALVAGAIYAPELLSSFGAESATGAGLTDASFAGAGGTFDAGALGSGASTGLAGGAFSPAATTPSVLNAGNADLALGNYSAMSPNFMNATSSDLLSSGIVNPSSLAPSMVDASGNIVSGAGAMSGAPMAMSMSDIMANPSLPSGIIDMTPSTGIDATKIASAATALKNAQTLLSPQSSSGGGGGGYGFAQASGIAGGSGGGQDITPAYNENLKMMGNYLNPIQSVNASNLVPSYKSMSSPMNVKRGGEIHDHIGHPEYPKSALETVFSTRGGSNYVQGKGTGQSDDIDAKLADGEYVFDADIVSALGDGSNKAGAQALDKMREAIREHKRSAPVNKIPPKARSPLAYLEEGNRK